jgi:hypothetical protein
MPMYSYSVSRQPILCAGTWIYMQRGYFPKHTIKENKAIKLTQIKWDIGIPTTYIEYFLHKRVIENVNKICLQVNILFTT